MTGADRLLHAYPVRFEFRAKESLYLPENKETNVFRGGLGLALRALSCPPQCPDVERCPIAAPCAYRRLFAPRRDEGPSGYRDAPRPFVLRWSGRGGHIRPGEPLALDAVLFDADPECGLALRAAVSRLAEEGLGPGRARVRVERVLAGEPVSLPLEGPAWSGRVRVHFRTPCEIKEGGDVSREPSFAALFDRVVDRAWTLGRFYQGWSGEWDNAAARDASRAVRTVETRIRWEETERQSTRTGQRHGIGGMTGSIDYEGPVGLCVPVLEAARWTGAGRQTVWGKGVIEVELLAKSAS